MRFSTVALAASAVGSAAAESICNKYTAALLKENTGANQYTLLTLLVNTVVIGNFTGPGTKQSSLPGSMVEVPGILAPGKVNGESVNLLQYFDGSLKSTNAGGKAVSVNFLDGGGAAPILKDPTASANSKSSAQYMLLTHLYEFFGLLLGCSEVGKSGFPAYGGDTSMTDVHRYMALDDAENTYFIEQVGLAAESFGVSASDAKAVGSALMMGFNYRCAPPAAIVPGSSPQLQAICLASDCPKSPKADCGAYPAVMQPAAAGGAMPTGGSSPTSPVQPSSTPSVFPGAAAVPTAAAGMAVVAAGALAAAFL